MAKEGLLGENEELSEDEVDDMMDIVDEADRSFFATRTQELPCY